MREAIPEQSSTASAEKAKQGCRDPNDSCNWAWVEAEVWADRMLSALATASKGQIPPSRMPSCSRFTRPGNQRDSLEEETTDWRAVCGKTARTVRRAGSVQTDPDPYQE